MTTARIAIVAAFVLGACSGASGPDATADSSTTAASSSSPPPSDAVTSDAVTSDAVTSELETASTTEVSVVAGKDVQRVAEGVDAPGVLPDGFTTVTAQVTSADGDVCEVCLWLADESDERSRGLMGVTGLGEPVGMAFVFEAPVDGRFVMIGTPTPLSIAWFRPDGSYLAQSDMEPCLTEPTSDCERYESGGSYDLAIEMFRGELGEVGIGPGATVRLLEGTESASCMLQT